MKLMGLPNWMHWLCWFLDALMTSVVSIIIAVLFICVEWKSGLGSIIGNSDGFLIFCFLVLYAMALIVFLFALSTLFSSREYLFFAERPPWTWT